MMDGMSLEKLLAMLKMGPNPVPMGGSENPLGDLSSMVPPTPGAAPGGQSPFAADPGQAAGLLAEAAGPMGSGMLDTGQEPIDLSAPGPSNEFNMVNQPGGGGPMLAEGGGMDLRKLLADGLMGATYAQSGVKGGGTELPKSLVTGSGQRPVLTAGKTHTTGGPGPDFAMLMKMLGGGGMGGMQPFVPQQASMGDLMKRMRRRKY